MKYAVGYERTLNSFSAYVPDLPGCIATGKTRAQVERQIREAITFPVEGLRKERQPVPEPAAWTELVEASS